MTRTAPSITWHPKEFVTEPRDRIFVQVLRDHWWLVDRKGRVAIHDGRSPQCNSDERIARMVLARRSNPEAVAVEQIPLAFVPINPSDY